MAWELAEPNINSLRFASKQTSEIHGLLVILGQLYQQFKARDQGSRVACELAETDLPPNSTISFQLE